MVGGSFYFLNSTAGMKPFHGGQCREETEQVAAGRWRRVHGAAGPWGGQAGCEEKAVLQYCILHHFFPSFCIKGK